MISQERAEEIKRKAQDLTQGGPWADKLQQAMTAEEHELVMRHWNALPGDSSYMDAFLNFLQGTTGEMG